VCGILLKYIIFFNSNLIILHNKFYVYYFYTVTEILVFELSKTFNIYVSHSSYRVYLARAWSDAQTPRLRNTRRANSLMRMNILKGKITSPPWILTLTSIFRY